MAGRPAEPGEAAPELVAYLLQRLGPPLQGVLTQAREAVALGERIQAALEALKGSDASAVADLELPATGVAAQLRGAGSPPESTEAPRRARPAPL